MVLAMLNATTLTRPIRRRLTVLRNRGFRRLLAGRSVSVLGDGLYSVAAMWLVYELTGSTAYTGLAGALTRIPGVLNVFVGPLIDRARLGRILTFVEIVQGVLVLVVPVAALLGHLNVAVVLAAMLLLSLSGLPAMPAQNATLPQLVPDDALVRANSAFSVATKTFDATARGVAGVLIALFGSVALYLVNAGTFALAALLFASLSIPPRERTDDDLLNLTDYFTDLREGIGLLTDSVAGLVLVASLFANFLIGVALSVLPAFADAIGSAETYGLLLAGLTVGEIIGSVGASAVDRLPFGWTTIFGITTAGLLWIGAILVPWQFATVVLFAASRVPIGVYNVSVIATFQTGVPDDLLGRVWATTGSATSLVVPVGLLLGGFAGELIGSRTVMLAGGIGSLMMAAYWLVIPSLRRFDPPTEVTPGEFG
jgi:hypothetical protein